MKGNNKFGESLHLIAYACFVCSLSHKRKPTLTHESLHRSSVRIAFERMKKKKKHVFGVYFRGFCCFTTLDALAEWWGWQMRGCLYGFLYGIKTIFIEDSMHVCNSRYLFCFFIRFSNSYLLHRKFSLLANHLNVNLPNDFTIAIFRLM